MSSFFTDSEKSFLASELDAVAKTFERPILISLEAQKTVISTNLNYNRFQANDLNNIDQNPINTPVIYTGMARIFHEKKQPIQFVNPYLGVGGGDAQLKLDNPDGQVRIKMEPSGGALLQNSKMVEFDGIVFKLNGVYRPHGLFSPDYWTIYLQRER